MRGKIFIVYYIANILNLLLRANIYINLFVNRLFQASM